jgi:Uma2 family endonuclease
MSRPRALIAVAYEAAAQEYLRNLPPEHFMESAGQSTQRAITVESLALVEARRPDFHVFSELLVQYPVEGQRKPGQVVPDNMVVLTEEPIKAETSYNVPLEPAAPFWVLEYVSKSNKRKDYDDNFDKYERQLKVPYYLLFYPDQQELTLYQYTGEKYVSVKPNPQGRLAIPRLKLEMGLLDAWTRFWYEGELLPLPTELHLELAEARRRGAAEKRRADEADRRAEEEAMRAAEEKRRADDEKRRADDEKRRADDEKRRADEEAERNRELQRRLEEAERRLAALHRGTQPPPEHGHGP